MNRRPSSSTQKQLDEAIQLHKRQQFGQARRAYRRLLKQHPGLIGAVHYLGVLEHMTGHHDKGLELLRQAHARDPGNVDIRRNLANVLNDINQPGEAEALYLGLARNRPFDAGIHANLSVALRKQFRFEEAILAAQKAVDLEPDQPAHWHALGNALASAERLEDAVAAYEKVVAMEPGFSPAHNSLCRVLMQIEQGRWRSRLRLRRTRAAYQRWVDANPGHPTATFMLDVLKRGVAPSRMPDEAVRNSFDAYADDFDRHLQSLHYQAPKLIADMLASVLPEPEADLDVLDGGCGTGLSGRALRPWARKLVGIDLSAGMLTRAKATGLYDDLVEIELGDFLASHPQSFDLCTCVDVLIYFGDLTRILAALSLALKPGGIVAFTVEKSNRSGSQLHPTGRYAHHPDHIREALASAGLTLLDYREGVLRNEGNSPVLGIIVAAQKGEKGALT